jgi:hypothetical protein
MKKLIIVCAAAFILWFVVVCAACSAHKVEYSDDSLIAFHESKGEDITAFTEVSRENCADSECHGEWVEIQEETDGVLEKAGTIANPHLNHKTKEIDCNDCHQLNKASTLYCNENCHEWELTKDNGTWAM